MDWADALPHLPFRVAVTDRKGRVLLLSGDIPGVKVGRSFLKLADPAEVVSVGRAAKRALVDGTPRTLDPVTTVAKTLVSLKLMPFAPDGLDTDHLLVLVGEPDAPSIPPDAVPTAGIELYDAKTMSGDTPQTAEGRQAAPLPPVPEMSELVVVAAGGTLPLARAIEGVFADRFKARAWPVAKFVDAIGRRTGGNTGPEALEIALDPSTRVLFIGDSPYANAIRANPHHASEARSSGWAISGHRVRAAAVWPGDPPSDPGDAVADLQFEMMEVVRRAMPVRKQGRAQPVDPTVKAAASFLETPAAMDMSGKIDAQARHHQMVMAIVRFIQEGMDLLIGNPTG